ncbi:MAG TPA: HD domain-containing phosphohydrolase [Anaerolineales bacterium]|nr:HD domain-containing phosphohydrolase [Anaerolineales bacterium]
MTNHLRILFIEDSEEDAHLLLRELKRGGYDVEFERVETAEAMRAALRKRTWDILICDYSLPQFGGLQALAVLKESGLDLPFIIVSGTIGEESAVSALKAGAHDFIVKGSMPRLIPAIQRELKEANVRYERRQRERELEAIALASAAMRSANTLSEMLPRLLDQTLELFETKSGSIWLNDPVRDTVELAIQRGRAENLAGSDKPGREIPGLVVKTGEALISREFRTESRLPEPERARIPEEVGGACVPLRSNENVIGALCINVELPREITAGEVRILNALAEMGGNTIQRMRLHEQTVRQLERLNTLRAIDLVISSTHDLQVTLNIVISQIIKQLEVDAVSILLKHPGTGRLEFVAGEGFYSRNIEASSTQIGQGYAGQAVLERRTVQVKDLRLEYDRFIRRELLADEGFIAYFGVPLIGKGEVRGVLEIFHRSELNPDQEWLSFLETLGGQTAIAIENAVLFQGLQRSNLELAMAYDATIEGWSHALDLRDKDTEGHTVRVTEKALKLARALGVAEDQLVHMRRGGLLHDIGKMAVPDDILLKPKPLTDEEWAIMRRHPQLAYDWLVSIPFLRPALDIPYYHHEKWDGTGYPHGLKGERIPLAARIFAVVDVWDALTNDRPYRKAWPHPRAIEYIRRQSGTYFDPQIVEVFLRNTSNTFSE